ncbi:MAG: hypothetical protein K2P88_17680 [Chitinophagaceae bacterium]|uniref:hypothetical protein n=1 Tax=unclassified Paraflavitalea TaxID=2798305 RepID=UPI003D3575A0|nr:hypothetical protein [Chitinophagaceae bacterium]
MEETNFVLLWKNHYEKIEQSLAINKKLLREITNQKAAAAMRSLIRLKLTGIIAAAFYLGLLGIVLFYCMLHYSPTKLYFLVSVTAIFLINLKALYDYIKHLAWASEIDYNGPIAEIQSKLTKLQFSIVKHAKIMCLQFPFYTTFYLSSSWFPQEVSIGYLIFQIAMTGGFTYLSYWLYKNHTIENLDKKWFRNMIAASGGKSVLKAMEFYRELEEFKTDSQN